MMPGVFTVLLALVAVARIAAAAGAERETPRASTSSFLSAARAGDWTQAATYLDLSGVPAARRAAEGRRDTGPVRILLRRSAEGQWTFAPRTVARVPALYQEFGYGIIDELLPRPLLDIRVLEVALRQWFALLLLAVTAWGVAWATIAGLGRLVCRLRSVTPLGDRLLTALTGSVTAALALAIFASGVVALAPSVPVVRVVAALERTVIIAILAWAMFRAVEVFATRFGERLLGRGQLAAVAMMPIARTTTKIVVLLFAVLASLQNLGITVTGVLAGLGIGGLAIALAAQKTVRNLFGGVSIILDQPVRVGDFCRFGQRIGTVEEVGLRSTRLRTLDRTVVSVPNAEFSALQLESFSRRDRIWLHATLRLRYETTPEQLRSLLSQIARFLREHPRADPDPARIRFLGFGAHSLDCEIFAYVATADYGEFLGIREEIFMQIMDAVMASGTSFALPSPTLYAGQDAGSGETKSGSDGRAPSRRLQSASEDTGTPGSRS